MILSVLNFIEKVIKVDINFTWLKYITIEVMTGYIII